MNAACFHRSSHLLELDLCEEDNHCPICQSMNRTIVTILQEDPVITLKQCQNCFAVSASRLPTQEALESYYYSYYQSNEKKITFDDPNRFVNHLFNTTYKHLLKKEELSILDYGGGIGTISIELGKRFRDFGISKVRITVVDYSLFSYNNESLDLEVKNYSTLSEVKDQEFDLIIASAILEHLPKPNVEITFPFGDVPICFKHNGRIFIEIYPNYDNYKITVRCDPIIGEYYRTNYPEVIIPGYHVPLRQRKYKNTVLLDKGLHKKELLEIIDHSYCTLEM